MSAASGFLIALKCIQFVFGRGSAPDPTGRAYSAPSDPLTGLKCPTSKGMGGKGRERGKGETNGRGREREGLPPFSNPWIRPFQPLSQLKADGIPCPLTPRRVSETFWRPWVWRFCAMILRAYNRPISQFIHISYINHSWRCQIYPSIYRMLYSLFYKQLSSFVRKMPEAGLAIPTGFYHSIITFLILYIRI